MPEYKVWKTMISRCHNSDDKSFKNYGARGIYVCADWRASFAAFYRAMGPRPSGETKSGRALYWIERQHNDRGYEPGNCVWATSREQAKNRRRPKVRLHVIAGVTMSRREALVRAGVTGQAVRARMKLGMTFEQAILAKRDPRGRPKKAS